MVWWSDSFGVLVMLLMSEGLVEKVRSRILSPLVGSSWSCVRPWLREISTSFSCTFLLAAPWATYTCVKLIIILTKGLVNSWLGVSIEK